MERISTLIKADAHGALESIEDRRLLAKQCIRDARIALEDKRGRLAELRAEEQRLLRETERLGRVMVRVDADVQLALDESDEELARGAIRKLLPLRQADRRLGERRTTLREEIASLADRVAVQEQELEVLKARLSAELATPLDVAVGDDDFEAPVVTDDDVELELLRRRGAKAGADGGAS